MTGFNTKLENYAKVGKIPPNFRRILAKFYSSYAAAVTQKGHAMEEYDPLMNTFLDCVVQQVAHPYSFAPFHRCIRQPFDYYQFGLDLLRPLIEYKHSKVLGLNLLDQIEEQLKRKENVILLANHQTEPDPQAISLLLENTHPKFAEDLIFVAGHRVISDPLAIPFSMGRNLLCIYSKKYLLYPPELKEEKLQHNQRTMKQMAQLLSEGGQSIYVAPSGGRDRPNAEGIVEVAKLDPQSIEMFWLMAQQSEKPTHFYPLTLLTYHLLPPPNSIQKELGENRHAQCTPIHMAIGNEINMEKFPGSEIKDKRQKRLVRAEFIWDQIKKAYTVLESGGY
jgi:glycerol-3-phosphate O-acyltransferase